jgi:hypothetical protein
MSVWSILLRVLLSLSLALNGVSAAAAAVHMPLMLKTATQAASTGMQDVAGPGMPCHGHHGASKEIAQGVAPAAAPDPAPVKSPSPDCCKSGLCRCACVHGVQATLVADVSTPAILEHDRSVRPLLLGHAAPAAPHLIRPPIG